MNSLLVVSGQSDNVPLPSTVHLLDLSSNKWSIPQTNGEVPQNLSYPAGWYDPPYVFIHGGRTKDKSLNDTYFLDLESFTWRKIFTMEQPSSRYGHCAVRNEDKQAYIFGGCNIGKKNERFLSDLNKLEYKSIVIVEGSNNVNGASWITNIATKGEQPTGRKGYQMIYLQSINSLILYGGETKQGINDNSVYLFNIDEKEWTKLTLKGEALNERAYHLMMLSGGDNIMVYGGKMKDGTISNDIFNVSISTTEVNKREFEGGAQEKRYCMSSCEVIDTNDNYHLMILGGKNEKNTYYEMDLVDVLFEKGENKEEKKIQDEKIKSLPAHLPPTNKNGIPISSRGTKDKVDNKKEIKLQELIQNQNEFIQKYEKYQNITKEL